MTCAQNCDQRSRSQLIQTASTPSPTAQPVHTCCSQPTWDKKFNTIIAQLVGSSSSRRTTPALLYKESLRSVLPPGTHQRGEIKLGPKGDLTITKRTTIIYNNTLKLIQHHTNISIMFEKFRMSVGKLEKDRETKSRRYAVVRYTNQSQLSKSNKITATERQRRPSHLKTQFTLPIRAPAVNQCSHF
ncbi:unnamed protein product [Trichogramma brassicae]|uniref:Uncharacterized protein n=1 Tax=Trichogramma brassicae TaxID=86971 RepID=A0A6H5IZR9_9HYME|nr:unnamed protein product [Trichogramma brassicae]